MARYAWLKEWPFFQISNLEMNSMFSTKPDFLGDIMQNYLESYFKKLTNNSNLNCGYYCIDRFNNKFSYNKLNSELSIFHLNIRSFNNNNRNLLILLNEIISEFDVIILSEIWSYNIDCYSNILKNYTFYYDLPVNSKIGGVGIFIKISIEHEPKKDLQLKSENDKLVENIWLEISKNNKKYIIGGIYRHPNNDISNFSKLLDEKLTNLTESKAITIIVGDLNIDLTKFKEHRPTEDYLNGLIVNNFIPVITVPTRITAKTASLIDHIYYNNGYREDEMIITGGNIYLDITDHLPNFIFISNAEEKKN